MGITKNLSKIFHSVQEMFNMSFDKDYNLNATEGLVYNPTTCEIDRLVVPVNINAHTGSPELRVYQENHICTQNTTTTPLEANATFTGEWQDCLNYQEVNVSIKASHNSATDGLVFQWSADASVIGDTDVYSYYAANGGTNYTPNPAFRYVRMVYTNGSTKQTSFSLMTILRRAMTGGSFHRIDSTLKDDSDARLQIVVPKIKTAANTYVTQQGTNAGNAKISLEELESGISVNNKTQLRVTPFTSTGSEGVKLIDAYGFTVENTPVDEMRTVIPVRLVGATFQNGGNAGAVDSNFWTATPTNNGTAVQSNNQVTLSTSTTANGAIVLQSGRKARYIGGSANRFRASIRLGDTGTTNNTRRWGMFDGTNGAYFKISGTTVSVCTLKTGSETAVASANWNGSTTVPTLTDTQNYEIYITNKKVYFVISGTLVHTATFNTTTWTDTTDLPVRIDNVNSGGSTTNVTMEVRVATIYRLGNLSTQPISKFQSGTTAGLVLKYGAGNLHGLIISAVTQNSVITLYDNTAASGTVIWASGAMGSQTQPLDLEFHDIPFSTGLTLVISGAACNVLIAYE